MNPSFIEYYDDALSIKECDSIISYFESQPQRDGQYIHNNRNRVDKSVKSSIEPQKPCKFSYCDFYADILQKPLIRCIDRYYNKYQGCLDCLDAWTVDDGYNLKKFSGKNDGYKVWHTEHGPSKPRRILVWTFYLNDALSGTEFVYYPTVEAKRGRCAIWPAGFTHVHRSEENKGIKYITSGWISYV
tara:strand:+ start:1185 stop:1745 length:561 start_codon:yes stop_codon:yes gene_type:complete